MGLKDVIRAKKVVTDWGEWKSGVKMPSSAFPLSKQRTFRVRACARWRLAKFLCGSDEYRMLVVYRPELERYLAFLARHDDGDMIVIARYEYSPTHRGWHIHTNCTEGGDDAGRTGGLKDRLPASDAPHRRLDFGIADDDQAFHLAAERFGLIRKQLLELQ